MEKTSEEQYYKLGHQLNLNHHYTPFCKILNNSVIQQI